MFHGSLVPCAERRIIKMENIEVVEVVEVEGLEEIVCPGDGCFCC